MHRDTFVVSLGVAATVSGVVSVAAFERAVVNRVPAGARELNRRTPGVGVALRESALAA